MSFYKSLKRKLFCVFFQIPFSGRITYFERIDVSQFHTNVMNGSHIAFDICFDGCGHVRNLFRIVFFLFGINKARNVFDIRNFIIELNLITIKKNNNINTISGKAAVLTAGNPFFFFANLDMCYLFSRFCIRDDLRIGVFNFIDHRFQLIVVFRI